MASFTVSRLCVTSFPGFRLHSGWTYPFSGDWEGHQFCFPIVPVSTRLPLSPHFLLFLQAVWPWASYCNSLGLLPWGLPPGWAQNTRTPWILMDWHLMWGPCIVPMQCASPNLLAPVLQL